MFFLVGNAWSVPGPLSPEQLADLADLHIVGQVSSVECTGPTVSGDGGATTSFYRAAVLIITLHDGDAAEGDIVYTDFERNDWNGNPPLCGTSGPAFPQGLIAEMYLEATDVADAYKSVHWNAVTEVEGSDAQELPSCDEWVEPTDAGGAEDAGGSSDDTGGDEDAGGSPVDAGSSSEDSSEEPDSVDGGGGTPEVSEDTNSGEGEVSVAADAGAPAEDTGSTSSSSGGCSVADKPAHGAWLMMTLLLGLVVVWRRSRIIRA
ncbi:MAG: hypothetical protein CMH54_09035 [Myxococcales bacterium]|nr:hypothetical protein [Myxococcales bacterium]